MLSYFLDSFCSLIDSFNIYVLYLIFLFLLLFLLFYVYGFIIWIHK